mmetsp:Transcript_9962/g.41250  ORF Transcript_9962/g.41250 Transcript_9962/m.41250 type:complete len:228 (-) Transcript_9962:2141-2824(-)
MRASTVSAAFVPATSASGPSSMAIDEADALRGRVSLAGAPMSPSALEPRSAPRTASSPAVPCRPYTCARRLAAARTKRACNSSLASSASGVGQRLTPAQNGSPSVVSESGPNLDSRAFTGASKSSSKSAAAHAAHSSSERGRLRPNESRTPRSAPSAASAPLRPRTAATNSSRPCERYSFTARGRPTKMSSKRSRAHTLACAGRYGKLFSTHSCGCARRSGGSVLAE